MIKLFQAKNMYAETLKNNEDCLVVQQKRKKKVLQTVHQSNECTKKIYSRVFFLWF